MKTFLFFSTKTLIVCGIVILSSCATYLKSKHQDFRYSQIERLKIGSSTEDDILKILGTPNSVNRSREENTYFYFGAVQGFPILSLGVDPSSNKINTINWTVLGQQAEKDLKFWKERFAKIKFKIRDEPCYNPHYCAWIKYYDSDEEGIRIVYWGGSQKVKRVIFTQKHRKLSEFDPPPPPPDVPWTLTGNSEPIFTGGLDMNKATPEELNVAHKKWSKIVSSRKQANDSRTN